nr:hypothetical protein Iba_chr04aCG7380 [Ipomoea batatas]
MDRSNRRRLRCWLVQSAQQLAVGCLAGVAPSPPDPSLRHDAAPPRKHYSPQKIAWNATHPSSDCQSAGGVYRRRGWGRGQWRCRRSQGAPELETELLRKVFPVPLLLLTSLTLRKSRRFGESNFRSAVSILLRLTPPPPAASIH